MKDALSDLDTVDDFEDDVDAFNRKSTNIVGLSTGRRIEAALVKDDQVSFVFFKLVREQLNNFTCEVHLISVVKVDASCLWQVQRAIQDLLRCLHDLLLTRSDLIVKVAWRRSASNLCDCVDGDSPGGHGKDPVIDAELVLLLLKELLELDSLCFIRVKPSFVLNLDNLTERLVLRELAIDAFKVTLVMLKYFNEAIHAQLIPPTALLHESEAAAKNVTHIATSTNV